MSAIGLVTRKRTSNGPKMDSRTAQPQLDPGAFAAWTKDVLNDYYDTAAMEMHAAALNLPGAAGGVKAQGKAGPSAEWLRQVVRDGLEALRPPDGAPPADAAPGGNAAAVEWRPFLLLQKRYLEGVGVKELCALLMVGDRQMRRDHHRALRALAGILWRRFYPDLPFGLPDEAVEREGAGVEMEEGVEDSTQAFDVRLEPVLLGETIRGVLEMVARTGPDGSTPQLALPGEDLLVETDRVILRQVLIHLLHPSAAPGRVDVGVSTDQGGEGPNARPASAVVRLFCAAAPADTLQTAQHWVQAIGGRLVFEEPDAKNAIGGCESVLVLHLPLQGQRTLLVIDDQPQVVQLFQRFLTQRNHFAVIGVSQADDVLPVVRQHRPVLIVLDVMMPQVDGWETLQMLKLHEETRAIPVIVCSAWAAPDLAFSLGAAGFLKKPVTQKAFFEAIAALGL
jgi:CheY-like chemotaxis protein